MRSTFALPDRVRIVVSTDHPLGVVCIEKIWPGECPRISGIHIPVELAGVVAQAIERAAHVIETGPCARAPLDPAAVKAVKDFVAGVPELPPQVCTSVEACQARTTPCDNAARCGQMWP